MTFRATFSTPIALRSGVTLAVAAVTVVGSALIAPTAAHASSAHNPHGRTDAISVRGGVAHVSGWAVDPDTSGSIRVRLRIDNQRGRYVRANRWRSDRGSHHGWRAKVTIPQGKHRLCAKAVNVGKGRSHKLRCWSVRASYRSPGAPTRLRATATWNSVTLTWRAPAKHGGGVLHTYRITATDRAGRTKVAHAASAAHGVTLRNMRPSHHYTIRVRARNAAEHSRDAAVDVTTKYPPIPAQTAPAPIARSHYLRQLNGDPAHDGRLMRAMGAADAANNPRRHRFLSLLDIGGQVSNGVLLSATTTFISYPQLVDALEAYLDGYESTAQYNAPAVIALGTNNDLYVSRNQGRIWAQQVVTPLARYARAHTHRISVAGANDIEPGFSGSAAATRHWLSGFLEAGSSDFVFNGSADGCPIVHGDKTCNNGWTIYDMHWLSGGASPSRMIALPQIYNTVMPWQWQVISSVHSQPLRFGGPLTEHRACAQAGSCSSVVNSRAWRMLYNALRSDPLTSVHAMPYGPDLRIS